MSTTNDQRAVEAMGCEREGDECVTHFHRWEFCDWSRCARALAAAVTAEREKRADWTAQGWPEWAAREIDASVQEIVARAVTEAVQAEREKYLRVADGLDADAAQALTGSNNDFERGDEMGGTNLSGQSWGFESAARRIREVTT